MAKLDLIKETFLVHLSAPLKPMARLVMLGKEIINIPAGGAGVLGSALIKAIIDFFF
jgi:hypothetical protein